MKTSGNNANIIVGIETVGRSVILTNYGSFFQHYALRQFLLARGFVPCRFEDERPWDEVSRCVKIPLSLLKQLLLHIFGKRNKPDWDKIPQLIQRIKFISEYRRLIGALFEYTTIRSVQMAIAGGDSVWCVAEESAFLLDKPSCIRRISYAASSAWDKCMKNATWQELLRRAARSFYSLSVREEAGRKAIRGVSQQAKVDVTVDPVMLLTTNDLLKILPRNRSDKKRPYVFYYVVNVYSEKEMNLDVMRELARARGCELVVVGIQGADKFAKCANGLRPSPTEFLKLIKEAESVVTNSFHGIVFSLIFQKNFVFIKQAGRDFGNQNVRQVELLSRYGLEKKVLGSTPSCGDVQSCLLHLPDWDEISLQIGIERRKSEKWLMEALS